MLHYWPEAISCHLEAYVAWFAEQTDHDAGPCVEALAPVLSPLMKASVDMDVVVITEPMQQVLCVPAASSPSISLPDPLQTAGAEFLAGS